MFKILMISIFINSSVCATAQTNIIKPGAANTTVYFPLLKNKRIAVFANQTSVINNTHLVDTLVKSGINVVKIFGPEHGFRGTADAGEKVNNAVDSKTGIKVISLYGDHKKPTTEDLQDVDIMVFDIQDVGIRFYTFISSLEYYMEAAAENGKELIVLDRPNPNGHYVDGPVLEPAYKSFVGMQPIPIVYGMTMGEYAYMLAGESFNKNEILFKTKIETLLVNFNENKIVQNYPQIKSIVDGSTNATPPGFTLKMTIIGCQNYTHKTKYKLPIAPSPNLREMQSIYWYPSTCFFEGTVLSEGRGTDKPFQIFGHPSYSKKLYAFTPNPNAGAKSSKLYGIQCYGWNISGSEYKVFKNVNNQIQLQYLIDAYKLFPNKDSFFLMPKTDKPENYFFNKLAGNATLMQQLKEGKTQKQIKQSWQYNLNKFKATRKKYLLYK
jgi:uncharacterized protein YbbC (DUF1343 family)